MTGNVPARFAQFVVERPTCLKGGKNGAKYDDLALSLQAIGPTKSIRLDVEEVEKMFGTNWKTNIRNNMKARGIKTVCIAMKDNTVHLWRHFDSVLK
jgi:hypothetical protein